MKVGWRLRSFHFLTTSCSEMLHLLVPASYDQAFIGDSWLAMILTTTITVSDSGELRTSKNNDWQGTFDHVAFADIPRPNMKHIRLESGHRISASASKKISLLGC